MDLEIFKQVYSVNDEQILISKIGDNLFARIDYSAKCRIGLECLCPVISNLDSVKYVVLFPKHWFNFNPRRMNVRPIAARYTDSSLDSVIQYCSDEVKAGKYITTKDGTINTTVYTNGNAYLEFKEHTDEPKISVFVKNGPEVIMSFENDSTPIKPYSFCYRLKGTPSSQSASLLLRPLEPWENGGGV